MNLDLHTSMHNDLEIPFIHHMSYNNKTTHNKSFILCVYLRANMPRQRAAANFPRFRPMLKYI